MCVWVFWSGCNGFRGRRSAREGKENSLRSFWKENFWSLLFYFIFILFGLSDGEAIIRYGQEDRLYPYVKISIHITPCIWINGFDFWDSTVVICGSSVVLRCTCTILVAVGKMYLSKFWKVIPSNSQNFQKNKI